VVGQEAKPPSEVVAGVPGELEKLILRCLRKEPERRFQHMSDVKVELQEIKEESDSAVAAARAAARRPRRRLWLAVGLAFMGVLVVAGWLAWRQRGRALPPPRVVNLTAYPGSELEPALSPDGEQVAFSWEGEDNPGTARPLRHIWVMFVGGSEVRQLTNGPGNDSNPSWSPDGRQIAFIRETPVGIRPVVRAVHVISSQGGPDRKLSDLPVRALSPLAWTPDGRGVVATSSGVGDEKDPAAGGLRLLPVDGTPPVVLTRSPRDGFHFAPAFSPDGGQLAYLERENTSRLARCWVRLAAVDERFRPSGQGERLLRMPAPSRGLTWGPDGRSVIFDTSGLAGNSHLFRVPTRGAASAERIQVAGREAMSPFVSPRHAQLAFVRRLGSWVIWALEPGRPARPWTASSTSADREPSYSPDGRRVAFVSRLSGEERGAWIADADGTHAVRLTRGPGGSPRWSPDGRRIAYDKQEEGGIRDIWTIDVEGGGPRRLTSGPVNNGLPCWSRDSRWIYYRRYDEQGADIWRVPADGGPPERVTNNAVRGPEFVADRCAVSFDGRILYYKQADGEGPLIAHPLDGGPERVAVACVAGRAFDVGPDGVYYMGCATADREQPLYRLEPATGRREVLGRVETADYGITVSPSGGPILFTELIPAFDLMLIENFR
jgi:Tol biopolymer transport system component